MNATALLLSLSLLFSAADPLAKATDQLNQGRFELALKSLDQAAKKKLSTDDQLRAQLLRAQCFVALRKTTSAKAALTNALKLNPELTMDPDQTSPDLLAAFHDAKEELIQKVSLTAKGDEKAKVKIDGRPFGPLPLTAELTPGKHELEVSTASGSRTESIVVRIAQGQSFALELPEPKPTETIAEHRNEGTQEKPKVANNNAAATNASTPVGTSTQAEAGEGRSVVLPVVGIAAGVVLMGGGVFGVLSGASTKQAFDRQQDPNVPATVSRSDADRAKLFYTGGMAVGAVGLAVTAISVAALVSGGDDGSGGGFTVTPTPNGAAAVYSGRF